jgi:hypothetical protein
MADADARRSHTSSGLLTAVVPFRELGTCEGHHLTRLLPASEAKLAVATWNVGDL